MKKLSAFLLSACFWISTNAQETFTLDQAIQYALASNNQIKSAQLDVADAEGQLLEYKATGLPKINGNVQYQYFPDIPTLILPDFIGPSIDGKLLDYNLIDESQVPPLSNAGFPAQFGTSNNLVAGVELSALLFDGSFFVGLKAQRLYRELVGKQVKITEQDLKLNVTKAFLAVLIAQKNQDILSKNISNLQSALKETKAIYENGFAEKLDVDRLQLSLNNLQVEQKKVDRLISLSFNLLKFQMGYPIENEITVEGDIEASLQDIPWENLVNAELNLNLRPEYPVMQLGEELARINIKRYKSGYLPSLYGFANYAQQLQRNKLFDETDNPWFATSYIGFSLNIPIFDGLDKKSKIQRAQVLLDQTLLDRAEFERGVNLEVSNAKVIFMNAREGVQTTQSSLNLAQEIYNTTQVKYKEGVGSSIEVTQAERELYAAQSNYTNALYEMLVAKTDLEKALGKL